MKRTLLFTTIASILTLSTAYASSVITSQTYVDNRDALKVDIAQGVGTNNANVGKTLVVNSSGNLELGTPTAENYVEDSITDGVTNKAPSENAVHDALENKQNKIPISGTNASIPGTTVVTYTGTAGQIGERGIFDFATGWDGENETVVSGHEGDLLDAGTIMPTMFTVATALSGGSGGMVAGYNEDGMLDGSAARGVYDGSTTYSSSTDSDKLITAGAVEPVISRGIYDGSTTYDSSNDSDKLITAGAVEPVISRGVYDGSTTYNSSTDSDKLATAGYVQSAVDNLSTTTVTRKTCTEWVANASHTDSNCLLWNLTEVPGYIDNSCSSTADCSWKTDCEWGVRCQESNHLCECNPAR